MTNKQGKTTKSTARKPRESQVATRDNLIELPQSMTIRQLSDLLKVDSIQIIKHLMRSGIMANINQVIDYQAAAGMAKELGLEVRPKPREAGQAAREARQPLGPQGEEAAHLQPRPPVVTVMGHVNHGKTKLLDAIRQTHVMEGEAGGITQHIGAYQVTVNGQKLTFLDTPGHEAFTAMRSHGAQITDICILVVAADDGVMPQTVEAINHAKAAGVPIVVAINKIDRPNANIDLVKQQLADAGLLIEEWGGDTVCMQISAKERTGIEELLEGLLLVAEVEELKADPTKPATGVVIEAEMDKTKGPLATVLVQSGTLKVSDNVVVGTAWGRVRAMISETGKQVKKAGPSSPAEILGLNNVPSAGDILTAVASEKQAQTLAAQRKSEREAEADRTAKALSLSNLYDQISSGKVKELNVIIKTDVQGSVEPVRSSLEKLSTDQVKVRIIHSGAGNVTESDVMLAIASKGLIIGFGVGAQEGAKRLAGTRGVDIRFYDVIYNLIDDVNKALKGLLEPTYTEVTEGRAEVIAVFPVSKSGKVAGVRVTEGKITRGASTRVYRGEEAVGESTIASLKRYKDDVKEVATGYECGVGLKDFNDFQVGDVLESFRMEQVS